MGYLNQRQVELEFSNLSFCMGIGCISLVALDEAQWHIGHVSVGAHAEHTILPQEALA